MTIGSTPKPRVEVAIGILVRRRDERIAVLITRRPRQTIYAGYWEFPGGKVESGESPEQCLAREFAEELGMQVRVGEPLTCVEYDYDHAHVRLHPFLCDTLAGEPRNLQVADHRWISPRSLDDYCFPEANAPILIELRQRLLS